MSETRIPPIKVIDEIEDEELGDELFAGCGAAKFKEEEEEAPEEVPEEEPPYKVRKGYSNTPSLPDQYLREGLWERGPAQVKVFHLSDIKQVTEYNAMLGKTTPESAPQIVIEANSPIFSEKVGDFVVFFSYREILYKNLIVS